MFQFLSPRIAKYRLLRLSILSVGVGLGLGIAPARGLPSDFGLKAPARVEALLQTPLQRPQVDDDKPSAQKLTVPGLWWADRQFGDKMVLDWSAYRRPNDLSSQVRAIIRPDLWSRYSYLERYAFLRRFGSTTSAAGYHLLVLDRQNYLLGSYTCDFPAQTKPAPIHPSKQQLARLAKSVKAPCNVWISPVYGSEFF
ncbi:hypothetical protein [Altericista sp. CCNU0014]|uniref:hypothetical protein n=1 Tax=Altericista sp. CCNU0014 TaxID=3082949 RepID=UPI0038512CD8